MANTGPLPSGSMLEGRYKILDVIGKGGMGRVYSAIDTQQNSIKVAIKELLQQNWANEEERQEAEKRFQKEANILKDLKDPHLPHFYTSFSEGERLYFVMEFIPGNTLAELMSRSQFHQLSVEEVVKYAIQLCDVLQYLHSHNPPVISRDLKPKNVMVLPESGHVYLIDFGIARFFKPEQMFDTEWSFSRGFSAPELVMSSRTEPRSDLYSLGATLHFCLTGHPPVDNNPTLFSFPSVRAYNSRVPVNLDNLILQLVSTRIEKRPASAQEVRQQLEEICNAASSTTGDLNNAMGSYYDPQTARNAQFSLWLRQLSKLPGLLGMVWSVIAPICHQVGAFVLACFFSYILPLSNKVGRIVLRTTLPKRPGRQRAEPPEQRKPRGKPPPEDAQSAADAIAAPKKKKKERTLPKSTMLVGEVQGTTFATLLMPFMLTSLGSICLLQALHVAVPLVVLFLSLVLLFIVLSAHTRWHSYLLDRGAAYWSRYPNKFDAQNQMARYLLSATVPLLIVFCMLLLIQSEISAFIGARTVGQALSILLIALSVAVLLTGSEQGRWLAHLLVTGIAFACIILQYNIKVSSLSFLTADTAAITIGVLLVIPGLAGLISVLRLRARWSALDRLLMLLMVCIYALQQILLGATELLPLLHMLPSSKDTTPLLIANILLALFPVIVVVWSLCAPGRIIDHCSLALLASCYALLLWFQGSTIIVPVPFAAQPAYTLATKLIDIVPEDLLCIAGLTLLAVITLLRLLARARFPFWDYMIVFTLALSVGVCGLLAWMLHEHGSGGLPSVNPTSIALYLPILPFLLAGALFLLLAIDLILSFLATFLHLIQSAQQVSRGSGQSLVDDGQDNKGIVAALVPGLDRWVITIGRLIVVLSTVICTLLWTMEADEPFAALLPLEIQPGTVLSFHHYVLIFLLLLTLSACVWLWYTLRKQNNEGSSTDDTAQSFSAWMRWLLFIDATITILLLMGKKFSLLLSRLLHGPGLTEVFPHIMFTLQFRQLLFLPLAVVIIQLFWLCYTFHSTLRKLLLVILLIVLGMLVCIIVPITSIKSFLPYFTIGAFVILIECVILVTHSLLRTQQA